MDKLTKHQESFNRFLKKPFGLELLQEELTVLDEVWKRVSGDFLCAFCLKEQESLIKKANFNKRVIVSFEDESKIDASTNSHVCASPELLPFLPGSIDAIFLPHLLEFFCKPRSMLSQAQESLRYGGYLIILGFNPWSAMSILKWLKYSRIFRPMILHSLQSIICLLEELRLDIVLKKSGFYKYMPFLGSVYVIVAQKGMFGANLLRREKKERVAAIHQAVAEPARREAAFYEEHR